MLRSTHDISAPESLAGPANRRDLLQAGLRGAAAILGASYAFDAYAADPAPGPGEPRTYRRVVAGNNAQGKSYFISDERVAGRLWETSPALPLGPWDAKEAHTPLSSTVPGIEPAVVGGLSLNTASIAPWAEMKPRFESGAIAGHDKGGFHRTRTLDLVLIAAGSGLTLLLDEGEVILNQGDVVVQRNTRHAWKNLISKTPITMVAVMVKI